VVGVDVRKKHFPPALLSQRQAMESFFISSPVSVRYPEWHKSSYGATARVSHQRLLVQV
jgi:hypothetical protein